MVKKAISIFIVLELLIGVTYFISPFVFANIEVAFLSSFFVIMGTSYGYKRMVDTQVAADEYEEKRDLLDEIEDPHELYDDEPINNAPAEELDLKAIVKEEKAKIKTFSFSSMKHGAKGSISVFRLIPYLFLIFGFIALKNNEILSLFYYLPALFIGIIAGSVTAKEVFSL